MNILKMTSKVLRIETFIVFLSGVFMLMNALKVRPLSIPSFLVLIGSLVLLLLMDTRMVRAKRELSRAEALRNICLLFFLGLFLLYSPLEMMQYTRIDSFNIVSLLLGIALLVTNSFLLVALWVLSNRKSSS